MKLLDEFGEKLGFRKERIEMSRIVYELKHGTFAYPQPVIKSRSDDSIMIAFWFGIAVKDMITIKEVLFDRGFIINSVAVDGDNIILTFVKKKEEKDAV